MAGRLPHGSFIAQWCAASLNPNDGHIVLSTHGGDTLLICQEGLMASLPSQQRDLQSQKETSWLPATVLSTEPNSDGEGRLPSEVGPLNTAARATRGCAMSVKCIWELKDLSKKTGNM